VLDSILQEVPNKSIPNIGVDIETPPYTCAWCPEPMSEDGYLCPRCWKEREAKLPNKFGLVRHEGIEYFCDCAASGSDAKGNKWVIPEKWKHTCYYAYHGTSEKTCECPNGSRINPDGTLTVTWDHASDCPVLEKLRKESERVGLTKPVYANERVLT
jgi:hypothetical protein